MTHAVVALGMGKTFTGRRMPPRFWALSMAAAMLPDADVVGFAFGIRYGSLLGHRGLSHSLAAALLVGLAMTTLAFSEHVERFSAGWWKLWAYFSAVTASHGVLDAMTNGGLGIAFFAPFENSRYFFPWRPVQVSPIGIGVFSTSGYEVLLSEVLWIWVPLGLVVALAVGWRYMGNRGDSKAGEEY